MKKSIKTKRASKSKNTSHTGMALLFCFLLASIAVAIALRQLALERRLSREVTQNPAASNMLGSYSVTVTAGRLTNKTIKIELNKDRTAKLTYNSQTEDSQVIEDGNWSGDSNGTIITNFKDKVYAFTTHPMARAV
jgi:uncharacterized protein YpmS